MRNQTPRIRPDVELRVRMGVLSGLLSGIGPAGDVAERVRRRVEAQGVEDDEGCRLTILRTPSFRRRSTGFSALLADVSAASEGHVQRSPAT